MHRWKLSALAAAALVTVSLTATDAWALTLGRLSVQSGLGEPLRAQVELPQITAAEADSLRASIASPAVFRTQGMEYTAAASQFSLQLQRRPDGSAVLQVSSAQPVTDAFVDLVIDATWSAGQVVRSYTLLLEAPAGSQSAPATNAPQIAPAPAPLQAPRSAPARTAPAAAPAAPAAVSVRSGDTASQIAQAHRPAGVSLDQMLVAMLRANPHAFISGNVNRMRAGAVMELPDQAAAQATSIREARQIVAAQSQDFNRYRRQLASAAPAAAVTAAQRSASGNVEARVDDRKPSTVAPDKLTLSKAAAADERLAREKQAQSQSDRMAELSRNLNELQNVAGAAPARTSAPAAGVLPAGAPAAGAAAVGVPGVPAVGAPAAQVPAPDGAAAATTPAATEATPPASDAAAAAAAAPATATPETPAASAAPVPAPAAPVAAPAPAPEPAASGAFDNPALPLAGIGLLALLLGYLGYRQYQRRRTPGASTDTQLPGDSRFGASQDPQIDTAQPKFDSPAALPGQPDTGGAVDPLAEADAYLAYGRDVQAEEVLKEALRNQPERLALHQKLADIHAKRQDRKAFEGIAKTVFALTQGKGAEWLHLAEQGRALDPANALYQAAGAAPPAAADDLATPVRPDLDERAIAQASVAAAIGGVAASAAPAARAEPAPEPAPASSPDLDLGLALPASEPLPAAAPEAPVAPLPADIGFEPIEPVWKQPAAPTDLPTASGLTLPDLELRRDGPADALPADAKPQAAARLEVPKPAPDVAQSIAPASSEARPKPATPAPAFDFLEFDMGNLSLDLGDTPPADALSKSSQAAAADPLATKLALAQEFAALGDSEGARTLLEEVIDEAEGELKERAQRQLAEIK